MYQSDYFLRQIDEIGRFLRKFFKKSGEDDSMSTMFDMEDAICTDTLVQHMLEKFIDQGDINKAENYLFSVLENQKDWNLLEVVYWFYSKLAHLPEKELEEKGFSQEEVMEGLQDALDFFPEVPKINFE